MLIASIDPATKDVVMVSFPRDISNFKLWDGRPYSGKLNSLMTYALLHPKEFPDGPINTLTKELGYLLGVPIYYYAAINLDGFKQMVDLVGGVTVTYDQDIFDPSYAWEDAAATHGFVFHAGTHHLDGKTALAFVRSRKADSDFARAARQQILLDRAPQAADPAVEPAEDPGVAEGRGADGQDGLSREPGRRHGRARAGDR